MMNKEFNRMKFLMKGQSPRAKPLNMDIIENDLTHFEQYARSGDIDSAGTCR